MNLLEAVKTIMKHSEDPRAVVTIHGSSQMEMLTVMSKKKGAYTMYSISPKGGNGGYSSPVTTAARLARIMRVPSRVAVIRLPLATITIRASSLDDAPKWPEELT